MKKVLWIIAFVLAVSSSAKAFETKANNAILVDYDTGAYIFAKNHDVQLAPASMSKLMTIYIIFDKLQKGELSLEDEFVTSENAWRKGGAASGGSTMFLNINETVKLDDLIRGIIIQSGNDACIVAAENIAGSEEDFAGLMNETADKIGLKNSIFANATGLPDENQRMSAEDLALLAHRIIQQFPEYYHIFKEQEFTHNGIKQGNRNPLLYTMSGADGLKTGHTEEAGFCLTASAERNGRRLIEVLAGLSSNKERSEEAENLMSYGFREFDNYTLFKKGDIVSQASVWYGTQKTVDLAVASDVVETLKRNTQKGYVSKVVFDEPLIAPVQKGKVVGYIEMTSPEGQVKKIDVVTAENVNRIGVVKKFFENVKYYIGGAK